MTGNLEKKDGAFIRFINAAERAGNKLPHPLALFSCFGVTALLLSFITAGAQETYMAQGAGGALAETTVTVRNLLTADYARTIFRDWTSIYVNFAPLGIVMVMMLAIGFAQETGLFDAFMKKTLLGAPPFLVTFALAVIGITASIAANAGIIFGATIGAALFSSLGRNPIVGAAAGYAAAHAGFSASLIPTGLDVQLAAITQSAMAGMGIDAPVHVLINYFFMFVATVVLAVCITFVTERVMPKIVKHGGEKKDLDAALAAGQLKGLRFAFIALVLFVAALLLLTAPGGAFFRAGDGSVIPNSPLIDSIVAILFIFFIVMGFAYGVGAGTVKSASDVAKFMGKGISDSAAFFVIAFPAAMFIRFFGDSHMATVLAVRGARLLESFNFTGIPLIIAFIFVCGFFNLMMTSATAKWLILAPVFVPMFAYIGFSPALTQLAFRIGDSFTNPIAPVNFFLPIVLGIMNSYKRKEDAEIGLGTLISYMLPYAIAVGAALILLLIVFMLFNIPLGPGAPLFM